MVILGVFNFKNIYIDVVPFDVCRSGLVKWQRFGKVTWNKILIVVNGD